MLYALNEKEEKIKAIPKIKAICPQCKNSVISKCGEINIWHFAHENLEECDNFSEGETDWHLFWKNIIKKEFVEITIQISPDCKHRADIKILNTVFELQNSPINPEQIRDRENFYDNMVWIFNGNDFINNFDYNPKFNSNLSSWDSDAKPDYYSFRWKHPRKSLIHITKPFFIDFGSIIFHVKKFSLKPTGVGWGYKLTRYEFIKRYFKNYLSDEFTENGRLFND